MDRMIRVAILLLCQISVGLSQRSDTIFQQLAKGLTSAPFTSAEVRNIGQSQHVIYVLARNAPTHTCNPHISDISIRASYDGTTFFPLSAGTVQGLVSSLGRTGILFASGLAPHVVAQVTSFDTTNCILDIFYAGSLYPVYLDRMENTLTAQGLRLGRFENAMAGTYVLAAHNTTTTTAAIAVYGFQCSVSANDILQIATASAETENFYVAANSTLTIPPGNIPWLVVNPGQDWTLHITGAGDVTCFFQWRYE